MKIKNREKSDSFIKMDGSLWLKYWKLMVSSIGADKVIDRTYPLSESADAFRYCEKGHAKGKVIIIIG